MTAVLLALLAAALFAASAALQQRAARRAAADGQDRALPIRVLLLVKALVRDRWWLAGWVLQVVAFAAHVVALHLGSLTAVQALLVTQLLFALVFQRRPNLRAWIGTVTICAGLAVLVFARPATPAHIPRAGVVPGVLVAAAGIVAFVAAAHLLPTRTETRLRGALAGTAAGVTCCLTAVFVVLVTDTLASGGPGALLRDWSLLALVASTTVSGLLTQDAFAAGSLSTALTAISIADPLSSAIFDATVFDAGWRGAAGWPWSALLVVALLITGVVLLSAARTRTAEAATAPAGVSR